MAPWIGLQTADGPPLPKPPLITMITMSTNRAHPAVIVLIVIIVINGGFGKGGPSAVWSPIHGAIYFVFVLSIANLGFKVGWSLPRMILTMMSGFVPVLPFIVERKVAREVEAQLAGADPQVTLPRD